MSFVFLAYASYCLARLMLGRARGLPVVLASGALMMLLDVVIDPLAVRGDRWFLGRVFYYPEGGVLFGVPLSNFAGWVLVGWLAIGAFLGAGGGGEARSARGGAVLDDGVLAFNLVLAWWIGERVLLGLGVLFHLSLLLAVWSLLCWPGRAPGGGCRERPAGLRINRTEETDPR